MVVTKEKSASNKLRIAVIPGDGIGNEVVPEGIRVLEAVGARFGIDYAWDQLDWSCQRFAKTGAMIRPTAAALIQHQPAIRAAATGATPPCAVSRWSRCAARLGSRKQRRRGLPRSSRRSTAASSNPALSGGAARPWPRRSNAAPSWRG